MEFNLVDDPWLPAVVADGSVKVLSLREVLRRAAEVRGLALDSLTQQPAVLRLLLAVVHRALDGPVDDEQWSAWWRQGAFDAGLLDAYLDRHRHRFGLFDPQAPFFQAGGLEALNGKTKSIALLVPHMASGHNVPLFSAQRDALPEPLSAAQAARWLVHAHAWDTAAIKTGAVGDPKAKAGKTLGNPVGSLGALGVVMPLGPTLWHTLMCNLLPLEAPSAGLEADMPVWERPALAARWEQRMPTGRLDVFTWPARRIRLVPEAQADGSIGVRQVVVCGGDRMALGSGQELRGWLRCEPHTAWKRSTNLERKYSFAPVYWPVRHAVERQVWRGLGPLLAHAEATGGGKDAKEAPEYRAPEVLRRLGGSRARREALRGMPLRILAVGIEYGNKSAVIEETYGDRLPLPVAALSAEDRTWRDTVLEAVQATSDAVTALAMLAQNTAQASGCQDDKLLDGHRERARTGAYAALDALFRRWLATLDPDTTDPDDALDAWAALVRSTVRAQATELLSGLPPTAFRGRDIGVGDKARHIDATLAEIWFHRGVHKALHALFTTPDAEPPATPQQPQQLEPAS
jgi:CRISPR system Cascade subunit CasA